MNVKSHLSQDRINQFTVMTASQIINQKEATAVEVDLEEIEVAEDLEEIEAAVVTEEIEIEAVVVTEEIEAVVVTEEIDHGKCTK